MKDKMKILGIAVWTTAAIIVCSYELTSTAKRVYKVAVKATAYAAKKWAEDKEDAASKD